MNDRKTSVPATRKNIIKELKSIADPKLKAFSEALTPGAHNMLGIKTPDLRAIGKRIAKSNEWKNFIENESGDEFFEETALRGFVIGYAKMPQEELETHLKKFIPKITNWAICDFVCSTLTAVRKTRGQTLEFLSPYLKSKKEFEVRFGVVMLLDHFLVEEYIARVLDILNNIRHNGYYVKMGVAWALSIAFIKFPKETMRLLKDNALDDWTFNKTIQKIRESRRVPANVKERLNAMKR